MNLQVEKNAKHFYMYCAMFYANNRTIGYKEWVSELKNKVDSILSNNNVKKINMPMHSYHYLMGIYNPNGYLDNNNKMSLPVEVIRLIDQIASITEIQELWKEYEPPFNQKLDEFKLRFNDISNFFNKHFNFEPTSQTFFITRNWDTSGKSLITPEGCHILVGWKKEGINLSQILHEITHNYLDKCDLSIPADINDYLAKMPEEVTVSYARPDKYVEESLIRAIVVYLSKLEENITDYSLVGTDLVMLLPEKYLNLLENEKPAVLSIDYLNKLTSRI